MKNVFSRQLPCALLLSVFCTTASAHPTWFDGAVKQRGERFEIALKLTTSHFFPKYETAVSPERLQQANLITPSAVAPLLVQDRMDDHLQMRGLVSDESSAVWAVAQTKMAEIELDPASVQLYLSELGQPKAVTSRYEKTKRWRERYNKNAKVWVQLSTAPAPKSMLLPVQLPYELVPRTDLSRVKADASFVLCAYAHGKAVPGAFISLSDSDGEHQHQYADQKGCATLTRPSGAFLAHSIYIQESTDPDWDWQSHFASLRLIQPESTSSPQQSQLSTKKARL